MKTRIYATPAVKGLKRYIKTSSFHPLEVVGRYRDEIVKILAFPYSQRKREDSLIYHIYSVVWVPESFFSKRLTPHTCHLSRSPNHMAFLVNSSHESVDPAYDINPLTAGAAYIRVFIFYQVPPIKHVKDKMWHQSAIFENSCSPFCQIWIIFTHLKLWVASARHNFKWVKIQIE